MLSRRYRKEAVLATAVFMQDGAIATPAKTVIHASFPDERAIPRTFPDARPTRLPDLNTYEFWLWDFLQGLVYQGRVTNGAELKAGIVGHFSLIPIDKLRAVYKEIKTFHCAIC